MQDTSKTERSLARAVVDDTAGCAWMTMADGRLMVVLGHPERLKEELPGWYVFVSHDADGVARLLLKGVIGEYVDLARFLTDAGVTVMAGWQLSEQGDMILELVKRACFFLWKG